MVPTVGMRQGRSLELRIYDLRAMLKSGDSLDSISIVGTT